MGVVLVQKIDFFNIFSIHQISGQGFHLHFARRIETKMPEAATVIGQ